MTHCLAVLGLSGGELMLVLVAVLILFGAKKIPDFAKGLGQGIKEFKKASREVQDEIERAGEEVNAPPRPFQPTPTAEEPQAPPASAPSAPPVAEAAPPASSPVSPDDTAPPAAAPKA